MRKKYPSDTTDYQWRLVRSIFNKQKGSVGRPPEAPAREMLDAILYLMRHGGTWRSLPGDFPPWQSVYTQRTRWSEDGTLERAMKQLEPKRHRRGSRSKRYAPTLGIIDATFTESAYGGEGSAPSGYKRATGFFVHTLIDKESFVLGCCVLPANQQDAQGARALIPGVKQQFPSLTKVLGDKAYRGGAQR